MEIELKYSIPTQEIADEIWVNRTFFTMEEEGSREELTFDARYFDTADCDLMDREMAYRVRKEGDHWVAALKWKGHTEGALHKRDEINVPVENGEPNPGVFCESMIGNTLIELVGEKQLQCVLETKFHRRRFRLDTGRGIFEVSIDRGEIITSVGSEPILEVEIELFSGETEELLELGTKLSETFGLESEEKSKYARGVELIEKNRD